LLSIVVLSLDIVTIAIKPLRTTGRTGRQSLDNIRIERFRVNFDEGDMCSVTAGS
jgi:hypothetical protein